MEQHWVYVRTAAGESALQKRRRLAHHALRNVLLQVDGVTSVGALKRLIGDGDVVEGSLAELVRLRLIEKRWLPEAATAGADEAALLRPTIWRRSEPREGGWLTAWRERLAHWQRRRQARRDEKAFLRAYEVNAAEDSFAPVKLKPIRRGPRPIKNWLGRVAGAVLVVLACLVLLLFAFPYDRYRPELERRLASAVGETVSIGSIGFNVQPYPNLSLRNVAIGVDCDVNAIRVVPALMSLFGRALVVEQAQFEGMTLRGQGLARSSRWFVGGSADGITLRRVGISSLVVEIAGARLEGLSGEMQTSPGGREVKLLLRDAARGLRLLATPVESGYTLLLTGNAARLPLAPDLPLDYLEASGSLGVDALRLDRLEARVYGGGVVASLVADWARGGHLLAELTLTHTDLARLAKVAVPGLLIDGDLSGKLRIAAMAPDLAQLGDNLRVDGEFVATRGSLDRFDLVEALRATRPVRGGSTRFDRLSGTVRSDERGLRLGNLRLDAGVLQARGYVDIDRSDALAGRLELELRGPARLARSSAAVLGKLADPRLSTGRGERR